MLFQPPLLFFLSPSSPPPSPLFPPLTSPPPHPLVPLPIPSPTRYAPFRLPPLFPFRSALLASPTLHLNHTIVEGQTFVDLRAELRRGFISFRRYFKQKVNFERFLYGFRGVLNRWVLRSKLLSKSDSPSLSTPKRHQNAGIIFNCKIFSPPPLTLNPRSTRFSGSRAQRMFRVDKIWEPQ